MLVGTIPIAIADPELESIAAKDLAQLMVGVALFIGAFVFALATPAASWSRRFAASGSAASPGAWSEWRRSPGSPT